MQFSSNLVRALVMLATSTSNLILAQSSPVTDVSITLCQDWSSGCSTFNTYIYQTSFTDTGNVVASNSATLVNTDQINGISTLQVSTANVGCTFGNLIVSVYPTVVCAGYTVTINQASGQYNIGTANSPDNALNDKVLCFYCFNQS